jgi:hypothetical protein
MTDGQEEARVTIGEEIQCLLTAGWTWDGDKLVCPWDEDTWTKYKRVDSHKIRAEQFESELTQAARKARRMQGGGQ